MRLDFEFVGTSSTKLGLDPAEFRGMSTPRITDAILAELRSIAPGVSFFHDDVILAAVALRAENEREPG